MSALRLFLALSFLVLAAPAQAGCPGWLTGVGKGLASLGKNLADGEKMDYLLAKSEAWRLFFTRKERDEKIRYYEWRDQRERQDQLKASGDAGGTNLANAHGDTAYGHAGHSDSPGGP